MKRLTIAIVTVLLLAGFSAPLKAGTNDTPATSATTPAESARANTLLNRLDEINAIDKTVLNHTEKKELRKEVRAIKSELDSLGSGVYISVGAIIIILLLLIILL